MIDKEREELRRRISKIQSCRPQSRRYPGDVSRAVQVYVRGKLAAGMRRREICQELSLSPATVIRWIRARPIEAPVVHLSEKFREVAVVRDDSRPNLGHLVGSVSYSLTAPTGYRVDGLGVEQVLYLLRELR